MPLDLPHSYSTLLIRREAFERAGLTRTAFDERLNLTPDEFRVERGLIAIGPVHDPNDLQRVLEELEQQGLVYFDDFVEFSGSWPAWVRVFAVEAD